jgi:hypothetical protein
MTAKGQGQSVCEDANCRMPGAMPTLAVGMLLGSAAYMPTASVGMAPTKPR